MSGIYTCPERVERDGRLVAFEGERMTYDEAKLRGILPERQPEEQPEEQPEQQPKPKRSRSKSSKKEA